MDFDWIDCHFDLKKITPREVEEVFEDPFSIRLLPENEGPGGEARYFNLGKTINNRYLFASSGPMGSDIVSFSVGK